MLGSIGLYVTTKGTLWSDFDLVLSARASSLVTNEAFLIGSNSLKVLIKENKVIYQSINQLNSGWSHTVIAFHLHYLTVTLLNNSVELSSNLDEPVP